MFTNHPLQGSSLSDSFPTENYLIHFWTTRSLTSFSLNAVFIPGALSVDVIQNINSDNLLQSSFGPPIWIHSLLLTDFIMKVSVYTIKLVLIKLLFYFLDISVFISSISYELSIHIKNIDENLFGKYLVLLGK